MKSLVVGLLAFAAFLPALAAPVDYSIDFTVISSFGLGAPTGSFTYDPSAGFTNFIVHWSNATFDFTSSANMPSLASDPATGCASGGSNHQYGFLLMTQSATGCAAEYFWSGMYFGDDGSTGYSLLLFNLLAGGAQDQIGAAAFFPRDPSVFFDQAVGSWTVTADSSVPEPGTLCMMLFGVLAVAAIRGAVAEGPARTLRQQ